jgi:DNA-binding PadR family transcriptional regulator
MLGLVALRPRHGYELAAYFGPDGDLGMVCQLPMSLLYAQLKRLETLGLLEGTTELQSNRPPRRIYRLTPEGDRELGHWLDEPVRRIRDIRIDFLLKLFFSARMPDHDTDALLRQQVAACQDYLVLLEGASARRRRRLAHLVNQSRLTAARGTIAWLSDYTALPAARDAALGAGRVTTRAPRQRTARGGARQRAWRSVGAAVARAPERPGFSTAIGNRRRRVARGGAWFCRRALQRPVDTEGVVAEGPTTGPCGLTAAGR